MAGFRLVFPCWATAYALLVLSPCILFGMPGCVAPQPQPPPIPPKVTDSQVGTIDWLSGYEEAAGRLVAGFDPPRPSDSWKIGAESLFAVRIEGRGETQIRFIHLRVHSQPLLGVKYLRINAPPHAERSAEFFDVHDASQKAGQLPVQEWTSSASISLAGQGQEAMTSYTIKSDSIVFWMALYDETGKRLMTNYSLLPEANLRKGLVKYCEWAGTLDPAGSNAVAPTPDQLVWTFEAQASLISFGRVVNASAVAEPLLKRILPRSKQFGIWLFGRPKIGFEIGRPERESRNLPALAGGRAAWQLPLDIMMNDEPLLRCRLTATSPDEPLNMCAGVAAFEGFLINDPSRRFQMHLIAARRQTKPAGSQPAL
jgi:hypothetical protein